MSLKAISLVVPAQLAKLAISLAVQIVIARLLLPEGRGIYAICIATSTVLVVITHLGNEYGIRYLLLRKRITAAQAFRYLTLTAACSLVTALALVAIASFAGIWTTNEISWEHITLACLFSFTQLVTTQVNVLMTLCRRYLAASVLAVAEETLKLIVAVLLLLSFPTVKNAMLSAIIANVAITSFSLVRYKFLERDYERLRLRDLRFIYKYGLQSFWLNLSGLSTAHMGTLVLSGLMTNTQIGLYNLAFGLISRLQVLPDALNRVLVPASMANRDDEERFRILQLSIVGLLAFLIVVAPLFGLYHDPLIIFLFGPEYANSGRIALILFIGFMFKIVSKPIEAHFNEIIGAPKVVAVIQIFSVAAMVTLTYYGAITFGLVGAAIGSSVATAIGAIALFVAYRQMSRRTIASLVAPQVLIERIIRSMAQRRG